eukprot:138073_1
MATKFACRFVQLHHYNYSTSYKSAFSIEGKTAIVTGASDGLGKEICISFAKQGCNIIAVARNKDKLKQLSDDISSICTSNIETISADLSVEKECENIGLELVNNTRYNNFDYLVNNAGQTVVKPFLECTLQDLKRIHNINFIATWILSQTCSKYWIEQSKKGSIVNISSCASLQTLIHHSVYGTSKHAVDGLTKSMAVDLGPYGIRTNSVNPTVMTVGMAKQVLADKEARKSIEPLLQRIPLQRFIDPQSTIQSIQYLLTCEDINGVLLPIEGGMTC